MISSRVYKIAVTGPKGAGKSAFIQRCRQNLHAFDSLYGIVDIPLYLTASGHWVNFCEITSEDYHNPSCWQYAGVDGAIFVYSAENFEEMKQGINWWSENIHSFPTLMDVETVVLMTQMDVSNAAAMKSSTMAAAVFAGLHFASSKTGDGISYAIESLISGIVADIAV